jgi:hypothetical protein
MSSYIAPAQHNQSCHDLQINLSRLHLFVVQNKPSERFKCPDTKQEAMPIKKIILLAILGSSLLYCAPDVQNSFQSGFHAGLAQGYENGVLPGLNSVVQWANSECNSLFERLPSPYTDDYQIGYYEGVWAKWGKDCFFEKLPKELEETLAQFWSMEESNATDFKVLFRSLITGQSIGDIGFKDGLTKGFDTAVLRLLPESCIFFILTSEWPYYPEELRNWYPYKAGYYEGSWAKWWEETYEQRSC